MATPQHAVNSFSWRPEVPRCLPVSEESWIFDADEKTTHVDGTHKHSSAASGLVVVQVGVGNEIEILSVGVDPFVNQNNHPASRGCSRN